MGQGSRMILALVTLAGFVVYSLALWRHQLGLALAVWFVSFLLQIVLHMNAAAKGVH